MPAALLHLDGAQRVLEHGAFPRALARASSTHLWCYRLGALLPDLPLFEAFWTKVALFLVGKPYPESRWGTLFHSRGAGRWAEALLVEARRADSAELRALVSGFLTHVAFDRSMHPQVERAVRQRLRSTESHSQLHEKIENYQCMIWHRERRGNDGLGSPLMDRISLGPHGSPTIPEDVTSAIRSSLARAYGEAPPPRLLARWASGLAGYRRLLSTRAATISIHGSERFAEEARWVKDLNIEEGFDRGLESSLRYARLAAKALETGDVVAVASAVGDDPLV